MKHPSVIHSSGVVIKFLVCSGNGVVHERDVTLPCMHGKVTVTEWPPYSRCSYLCRKLTETGRKYHWSGAVFLM